MKLTAITTSDPNVLPAEPGAYLLMLRLEGMVALPARFNGLRLPEGKYVYAGNAYGPGGIRARCRHHLSGRGVRRWHVDWLTQAAGEVLAAAFPGNVECALIDELSNLPDVRFPVPGLGSTDCRQCPSHVFQVDDHRTLDALTAQLDEGR